MELRCRGYQLHSIPYSSCSNGSSLKLLFLDYSRLMYSSAIKIKIKLKYIFNVFTSKTEPFPGLFLHLQHSECVWEDELDRSPLFSEDYFDHSIHCHILFCLYGDRVALCRPRRLGWSPTYYVRQTGLELVVILLALPPDRLDYKCVPPRQAICYF